MAMIEIFATFAKCTIIKGFLCFLSQGKWMNSIINFTLGLLRTPAANSAIISHIWQKTAFRMPYCSPITNATISIHQWHGTLTF